MARTVHCVKLGKEAPGLDSPPFSGELGQEVYEKVSAEAWHVWQDDMMMKVINEYRLNLIDAEQYNVLMQQMKAFLNLDKDGAEVLEVGNASRGKSGH